MPLSSETGFDRPEIDQLRSDLNDLAVKYLGDDVDTSDSSVVGMLLGIISERDDLVVKLAQAVYLSQFLLSAEGEELDRHGADDSMYRKPAGYATVSLQIDATVNTEIPEQTQFSTEDGILFETTENAKITTVTNIKNESGVDTPLVDDEDNPLGRIMVNAVSVETGTDNNVGADTITVQAEPIDGVYAVTNPEASSGAIDDETDSEYRQRMINSRINHPDSTENGIKTYLENNVTGVKQARVIPNKTLEEDKYGNPPKTTHVYVIGGSDIDVANGIFDILAAPANTVGKVTETVYNVSGDPREISFDRAQTVPVHATITIGTNDDFDSDNGSNNIKTKMKEYIETLTMGADVLFSKFYEYIWQVEGLTTVNVAIGKDDNQSATDIDIGEFELATLADGDIEVIIND